MPMKRRREAARAAPRLAGALLLASVMLVVWPAGAAAQDADPGMSEAPAPPVRSGLAPVDGSELYFEEAGQGTPVVLLHGGLLDGRMWDDQFAALAASCRVIRYDARGYGRSPCPLGAYRNIDDLAALLDHLGIERAVLVGLSMGGRTVVDFALERPERVLALVPVSPGISGFNFVRFLSHSYYEALVTANQAGDREGVIEAFLRSWTDGPARTPEQVPADVRDRVRAMLDANIAPGKRQGELHEADPPAVTRLREIEAPTLCIVGELDMPDIHTIVDLIVDQVDGARKEVVPGVAHMVNMERPQEFARLVREFVATVASPAATPDAP